MHNLGVPYPQARTRRSLLHWRFIRSKWLQYKANVAVDEHFGTLPGYSRQRMPQLVFLNPHGGWVPTGGGVGTEDVHTCRGAGSSRHGAVRAARELRLRLPRERAGATCLPSGVTREQASTQRRDTHRSRCFSCAILILGNWCRFAVIPRRCASTTLAHDVAVVRTSEVRGREHMARSEGQSASERAYEAIQGP